MMKIYNQECKLDLNDSVVGGKTCEGGIFSKDPPFMYLEVICMHRHIQRIYPVAKELQRKKNKNKVLCHKSHTTLKSCIYLLNVFALQTYSFRHEKNTRHNHCFLDTWG